MRDRDTTILLRIMQYIHDKIPWRDIVGMRNIAAHAYGSIDMEMLWTTVTDRIPELKDYCLSIVNDPDSV